MFHGKTILFSTTIHLRGFAAWAAACLWLCLGLIARGRPLLAGDTIEFDEFVLSSTIFKVQLEPGDTYRDRGILFEKPIPIWNEKGWYDSVGCSTAFACAAKMGLSAPNGFYLGGKGGGPDPNGGEPSISWTFVMPGTRTRATTDWVRVSGVDGNRGSLLGEMVAYDSFGVEVGRVRKMTPSDGCSCSSNPSGGVGFTILEIRAPGIARIELSTDVDASSFDNLQFGDLKPVTIGSIDFDEIDVTDTAPKAWPISGDTYRDQGIVFLGDIPIWSLENEMDFVKAPQFCECVSGLGHYTRANTMILGDPDLRWISDLPAGLQWSIEAAFVLPGTCTPATTDRIVVDAIDANGGSSLGTLEAFDVSGTLLASVRKTTPTDCLLKTTRGGADTYEIKASGIARIRFSQDADGGLFDNLRFSRPVPLNMDGACRDRNGCTADSMEIVFPATASSVVELGDSSAALGAVFSAEVVIDAASTEVQGWSYGVIHDPKYLELVPGSVTSRGTVLDGIGPDFNQTVAVPGGWISAVVLAYETAVFLPPGRNTVARASYRLVRSPGIGGTLIKFVDKEIGFPGSPPAALTITIGSLSRKPGELIHGWIRTIESALFIRGDVNADGALDISDPIELIGALYLGSPPPDCPDAADADDNGGLELTDAIYLLAFEFLGGLTPVAPFPGCGPDTEEDDLGSCRYPSCDLETDCPWRGMSR